MFVLKYMTEGAPNERIDDDAIDYDPHEHRIIEKPVSYMETFVHLLKGTIGAGILALPGAIKKVGIIPGTVIQLVVSAIMMYCIHLLIRCQYRLCKRERVGYLPYAKSMQIALKSGPVCLIKFNNIGYCFVEFSMLMWQLGICVIYFVYVAKTTKQIVEVHSTTIIDLRLYICMILPPLLLLSLIKDLKMLAPVSIVANTCTLLGLWIVFWYLLENDPDLATVKLVGDLEQIPVFIGVTLFGLEAVGVVLALEFNMKRPKRFVGICGLFNIAMFIMIAMYWAVGIFGYIRFGEKTEEVITLNLPIHDKKAQASKILIGLAILLSYPLQMYVAYELFWLRIEHKYSPKKYKALINLSLRLGLVIFTFAISVAIPTLGPFISFVGAFCLSLLGIVFPGVIDLCINHKKYGFLKYRMMRSMSIIILGIILCVSGTYTSLIEIFEDLS